MNGKLPRCAVCGSDTIIVAKVGAFGHPEGHELECLFCRTRGPIPE